MIEDNENKAPAFQPSPLMPQPTPSKPPRPSQEISSSFFIINATKSVSPECEEYDDFIKRAFEETIELLSKGNAFEFTPIGIMAHKEEAFGPFETKSLASYMIPSELDEDGKDWKGHIWIYGTMPMIWEEYIIPNYQVPRAYWCRTCGHTQVFKGSCGVCRSNGKEFTPTIEIKDWDGDL